MPNTPNFRSIAARVTLSEVDSVNMLPPAASSINTIPAENMSTG